MNGDFDTIGEVSQQQKTVEKNIENFKHNNLPSKEINIHSKKQHIKEDIYKKEELEDKINEIKIYMKKQFEKESEKEIIDHFDDLSQNNNFLIIDNNNLDNTQHDPGTKYDSTGYNKINFLDNRNKTNCEGKL